MAETETTKELVAATQARAAAAGASTMRGMIDLEAVRWSWFELRREMKRDEEVRRVSAVS